MTIYLLHEKFYEDNNPEWGLQHYNVYPYRTQAALMERLMTETGKPLYEIEEAISTGDCTVSSGICTYEIEETELL